MTTYRTIIEDFERIADRHLQINSFGHGDLNQLIYWTTQKDGEDNEGNNAPIYPLLYVVPTTVVRGEQQLTYTFDIVVADIDTSKKTPEYTKQMWSDTLQISEDILAQFKYSVTAEQGDYERTYDVVLPANVNPFSERFDDLLVGWTTTLQVVLDIPLNRCISPYKDFTK